jgi:hypothetical protein
MTVAGARVRAWAGAAAAPACLAVLPFVYFWRATLGRVVLLDGDSPVLHFPMRQLVAAYLRAGHLPLWNPAVLSGAPLLGDLQPAVLYPLSWLFLICSPVTAMNLQVITSHAIAALGAYGYTRSAGCDRWAAVFAGVTFGFSSFFLARAGHLGIIQGLAWLPVLLWALERIRQTGRARFVLAGAGALACTVFAGHPQMPAYAVLMAAVFVAFFALATTPPAGRVRFGVMAALTVAGGVALTAVQMLPTFELVQQSLRARLTFAEFASYSLPVAQLPSLLFPLLFGDGSATPYWGGAQFIAEATGYVGIAAPILALAALAHLRASAVVQFWTAVAIGGLLLALGDALPLARLTYHLPVYHDFRAHVRMLGCVDLALAVLAALGLTHLGRRAAARAAALVVGGMAATFALALVAGERVFGPLARQTLGELAWRGAVASACTIRNPSLVVPVLFAVLAAALVIAGARWRRASLSLALLALQITDLWYVGNHLPLGFPSADVAGSAAEDVRWLRRLEPEPFGFRTALVTAGQGEPVAARPDWDHPMINGYDPMQIRRYGELAGGMSYWGAIPEPALRDAPLFLDLLNVRYLFVAYPARGPFSLALAGIPLAPVPLGMRLAPGQHIDIRLPAPATAGALAVVSALTDGAAVPRGTPAAQITLGNADGSERAVELRADIDTAPAIPARADGASSGADVPVTELAPDGRRRYGVVLPFDAPIEADRVRIASLLPAGAVEIVRVTLQDPASGAAYPLTIAHALLDQPERWAVRLATRRGAVLENRHVLPRAWLAAETLALPAEAVLASVRSGRLPDGRAFDPRRTALVEEGTGRTFAPSGAEGRAAVVAYEPNALTVETESVAPSFLVVSEAAYPGWAATIDDAPAEIVRTDYVLRGLPLPPGAHRVRFAYRPRSVLIGALISAATVVLVPLLAWPCNRVRGNRTGRLVPLRGSADR